MSYLLKLFVFNLREYPGTDQSGTPDDIVNFNLLSRGQGLFQISMHCYKPEVKATCSLQNYLRVSHTPTTLM